MLEVLATHSGNTRSKAVAKTTRVEDRNTDPTHPKNHSDKQRQKDELQYGIAEQQRGEEPGVGPGRDRAVPAPVRVARRVVEVPSESLGEEE